MSKEIDEKVAKLKQLPWEDVYDKDNMRVAKVGTFKTRGNWYLYQWASQWLPKGNIANIGCHDGALLNVINNLEGTRELYGIDISPKTIEIAKNNLPHVNFRQGSVTKLPFEDGELDAVTCTEVIEHLEDPKAAIKELHRVVKKGGTIVVTTPIENMLPDKYHLHAFRLHDIIDMFEELDVNFKISYIHKFHKNATYKELNIFGVHMRKGGSENDRSTRRV